MDVMSLSIKYCAATDDTSFLSYKEGDTRIFEKVKVERSANGKKKSLMILVWSRSVCWLRNY